MTIPIRILPRLAARHRYWKVVFALLAMACGDPVDPTAQFQGSYTLQTINGQPLPYVVAQSGQNTVSVTADQLSVADGGSWSEIINYRLLENGTTRNETQSAGGTWVRTGTSLAFYTGSTLQFTATITSNTLTFTADGLVQVFVK